MPRVYPAQLTVIQCPRKFAFHYESERVRAPDNVYQAYGTAVHERIEGWQRTGSMPSPESPESRTAALAVPFIAAGSFPEIRIEAPWLDGTRLAARVDNLELPDDPAAPVVATDWKTGKPVDLDTDIQAQTTAWIVGQLYGFPVRLRWVYLGRGAKKATKDERLVDDNTEWMRQHLAEAIQTTNDMWQLLGTRPPLEFPMNPGACESRGDRCDYYGLCKMRNRDMPTVAEIKAQHALRQQGNKAVNPVEIPKPEETVASPTAALRAEAARAVAAGWDALQAVVEDVQVAEQVVAVDEVIAPRRKPGRPRKTDAPLPAAKPEDIAAEAARLAARTGQRGSNLAPAAPAAPAAPEPVKQGQAAPETRSTWTLGDLQRLSEELASHGIMVTFGFKETNNG